jgi:alpha-mannosidase
VFTGPGHLATVVDDPSDTWSHGVDRLPFDGVEMLCDSATLTEHGAVRAAVAVSVVHGASRMCTTVLLPDDADLPVELRVSLDWRERTRMLRLAYPFGATRFEYEVAAGWIERPDDGREVAAQRWVRAVRPGLAVAIANDAKYSYAARDGVLFITTVRSPVFAHHDPATLDPERNYRHMDQGEQSFTLLVQARPDLSRRDAWRLADMLLTPPVVTPHIARGGQRPWRGQWLRAKTASGTVTALKLAEDSDALVLRALELEGRPDRLVVGRGAISIPPRGLATALLDDSGLYARDGLER